MFFYIPYLLNQLNGILSISVHTFLKDSDRVLSEFDRTQAEDKCLLLIRKPKSASKQVGILFLNFLHLMSTSTTSWSWYSRFGLSWNLSSIIWYFTILSSYGFHILNTILTLVLLNPDIPCHCKQCRSRSVGF